MTTYPEPDEYMRSVNNGLVHDDVLKCGQPCKTEAGHLWTVSGGFAFVFKFRVKRKTYALRCWTQSIGDADGHYKQIDEFLRNTQLPYFVECKFNARGITVKGQLYPTVRMEWVDKKSLREFIFDHLSTGALQDPSCRSQFKAHMEQAADAFLEMAKSLHSARVSHGDLQADNIKVANNAHGCKFKLIDYDTLCLPEGGGRSVTNSGLAAYQHPNRECSAVATEKDDYFSELVIYLSLRAIALVPELWEEFECDRRDKDLLFNRDDFRAGLANEPPTRIFGRLYGLAPPVRGLAVVLWNFTCCPEISSLLPIEEVLKIVEASGAPRHFKEVFRAGREPGTGNDASCNGWLNDCAFRHPACPAEAPTVGTMPQLIGPDVVVPTMAPPPSAPAPSGPQSFAQLIECKRRGGAPLPRPAAPLVATPPSVVKTPQSGTAPLISPPVPPPFPTQSRWAEFWDRFRVFFAAVAMSSRWAKFCRNYQVIRVVRWLAAILCIVYVFRRCSSP